MSFFSSLFEKKTLSEPIDLAIVSTDIHSHLIPGIDDGSQSMEDSLELVRSLSILGYKKLITTPHVNSDQFKNTNEKILGGLALLRKAVNENNIPVTIDAAAEYLIDFGFSDLYKNGKLLTFGNNNVLVELSYFSFPENFNTIIFELQIEGYRPILAHPERYSYWYKNFDEYVKLKDKGIPFQMNLLSLTNTYSVQTRKIAERLIENNMIDYVGTDTHSMQYVNGLKGALTHKSLDKLLKSGMIKNSKL